MLVRRSAYRRLEAELAATQKEFDRQRAGLIADIHREFEADVIGRLRVEDKEKRHAFKKRKDVLARLVLAATRTFPEYQQNPLTEDIPADKALVLLRHAVADAEALEEELVEPAGPTNEQSAEHRGIGRRVDWPVESGKTVEG